MLKTASGNTVGALTYKGTWDASTNTPTLQSGVGSKGDYYVVSVAGNTNLDGITDWQVGDWAVFNGLIWQKIDNTDAVQSVNGKTGVVVLTAADVGSTSNTTYVLAGTGLSGGGQLNANVTLNLANTAVTPGTYGSSANVAQITVDAQGRITSAANVALPSGTVTQVNTGTGLTGGPITSSGTISLANTAVTPASYTYASITVDQQGRLTAASNGTAPVTSVTGTSPVVSSGGTTPAISMPAANATTNGYLTSTDWNTFNNKQGGGTYVSSVSGTAGRISSTGGTTPVLDLVTTAVTAASYGSASNVASFTVDAYGRLTAASNTSIAIDVSAVSGAVPNTVNVIAGTGLGGGGALTGNVTLFVSANSTNQKVSVLNNGVFVGSQPGVNFIPGSGITISTFNDVPGQQSNVTISTSGVVTSVTGTAPVVSSGGTTPAISMAAANSTTNGYLTSTDWSTFNSKGSGSVTSVATGTGLTGGPITTTGTVSLANTAVTAGSYGSAGSVATFTVDAQGRLTAASNVTIVATQANFSNTAASATFATSSMMLVPEGYITILINGVNKKIPYYGV